MTKRSERGVVLLHALVVISVLAAVSAGLLRDGLEPRTRHALMVRADAARTHFQSNETLAKVLMAQDAEANSGDHLGEPWAQPQIFEIDGVEVRVEVKDLQGRLNVNGITRRVDEEAGAQIEVDPPTFRLLQALGQNAGADRQLAGRIAEWTTDQVSSLPGAAGDQPYLKQDPPLLRPAAPLLSVQDLRLADGMTPPVYAVMAPNLTALPTVTAINVNTAPMGMLRAMLPNARQRALDALVAHRKSNPFESVPEFLNYATRNFSPTAVARVSETYLDIKSEWFLIEMTMVFGDVELSHFSVLERPYDGESRILFRSSQPQ